MTETELIYQSPIHAPVETLERWHERSGAFSRLTPPWMNVRVAEASGTTAPGDWKRLSLGVGPAHVNWTLVHEASPAGFTDVQSRGPFASWRHQHRFLAAGADTSLLEDRLTYELPLGAVGNGIAGEKMVQQLNEIFRYRHRTTADDLARHANAALDRPQRIAITGASGLVGTQLVAFLRAGGHEVHTLVRRPPQKPDEILWNPESGEIDAAALERFDAVIHLAGVSLSSGRWTEKRKRAIRDSRVKGTSLLARTLATLSHPPRVLISTSAVGYYGDGGEMPLTESSANGDGFLAEVCTQWETAADPARQAGIRVVHPRFGVVLAGNGGVLTRLLPIFKLGAAGRLGSGRQYFSWIALDDLLAILLMAVANDGLVGPINAVAPEAVTNVEFTKTMGRVLHRPAFIAAPAPLLRFGLGQMADELLLVSQRVRPVRLESLGFPFSFPTLEAALRHELGRHNGAFIPAPVTAPSARDLVIA